MTSKVKIFRGYCTHNHFGEYKIPVPAQNIIYRDYCKNNKYQFNLSRNELFFENSDIILNEMLKELDDINGILMCSIFMLPENKKKAELFLKKILENRSEIHFILESIIVKNYSDLSVLMEILQMQIISKNCPNINTLSKLI